MLDDPWDHGLERSAACGMEDCHFGFVVVDRRTMRTLQALSMMRGTINCSAGTELCGADSHIGIKNHRGGGWCHGRKIRNKN